MPNERYSTYYEVKGMPEAELLADPTLLKSNEVRVPTDGADAGKHKTGIAGLYTYAQLPFDEDASSGGGPPSGAAGGDLAGTYPNPTIGANKVTTAKILDANVTNAKLANMVSRSWKVALGTGVPSAPDDLTGSAVGVGQPGELPFNDSIGINARIIAATDLPIEIALDGVLQTAPVLDIRTGVTGSGVPNAGLIVFDLSAYSSVICLAKDSTVARGTAIVDSATLATYTVNFQDLEGNGLEGVPVVVTFLATV